jgi:hypothetical protein
MALLTLFLCLPSAVVAEMRFKHHFGDRDLSGSTWGQTALADLDGDGDLDFITGQSGGDITWYEYLAADRWTRHLLGRDSPSEVGGAVLDVNRDGRPDFVTGGAWYENPSDPRKTTFKRHVFDAQLTKVHDVRVDDIDGDSMPDVVTMSDRSDVRWYKVAVDPTNAWTAVTIGPPVHSGICTGDMDADGDTDVIRSNVWFENIQLGQMWMSHRMTEPWGDSAISWQDNATQTRTGDLNGDGRLDVVIADGESIAISPDGKTLALASSGEGVRLLDTATGKERHRLQGEWEMVVFSCDSKTLALASVFQVTLWDLGSAKSTAAIEVTGVNQVAFSPDGKTIAVGIVFGEEEGVRLYEVSTGRLKARFKSSTQHVMSLAFSPDSKTLAVGRYVEDLMLWNLEEGKEVAVLPESQYACSIAFSPDGKILASGSADGMVKLWDTLETK